MKKYVKASYEDVFWDLHEQLDPEEAIKLEHVVHNLDLTDKVFTDEEESTATEEEFKKVIDVYRKGRSLDTLMLTPAKVLDALEDALYDIDGVSHIYYDREGNKLEFSIADRHDFELVLNDLGRF